MPHRKTLPRLCTIHRSRRPRLPRRPSTAPSGQRQTPPRWTRIALSDNKRRERIHVDSRHSPEHPTSRVPLVHVTRSTSPARFHPSTRTTLFLLNRWRREEDEGRRRRRPRGRRAATRHPTGRAALPARGIANSSEPLPRDVRVARGAVRRGSERRARGGVSRRRVWNGGAGEGRGGVARRRPPRPSASCSGDRRVRFSARISSSILADSNSSRSQSF
jgi:hypothetical protein